MHDLARWIGIWWFRPFLRRRVHHGDRIPATGPVVVVANHSSLVDAPLLFGLLGRRTVFLVKQELYGGCPGLGVAAASARSRCVAASRTGRR